MPEQSKTAPVVLGNQIWELPPLILHPFSNQQAPAVLLQGSKAALTLARLLPGDGEDRDNLTRKLVESRYAEIRMLYFVGKDLLRWIGQCVELVARTENLSALEIREQSFSELIVY